MPKQTKKARPALKSKRSAYVVVLTTCGSSREANRIARHVVAARLAACVNITSTPVRSIYRWKGKIEQAKEFLLLIKTSSRRLPSLQSELLRLHRYKVPEFLVLPVAAGSPDYLSWLNESTTISSKK